MTEKYHMRRKDRAITERDEIIALLRAGRFVTFALVDQGAPYVLTMSYGLDSSAMRLYFHAAHEGRKLDIIAREPRACATVVIDHGYTKGECEHPFESVVMDGTLRVVTSAEEKRHAMDTLIAHLEPDPAGYLKSRDWDLADRMGGFTALCFEIGEMSAKRGK